MRMSPTLANHVLPAFVAAIVTCPMAGAQSPHAAPANGAPFEVPAWAFPVLGTATAPQATGTDTSVVATVPTSHASFSVGRTRNRFDVADWNPATHRAAPPIVMHGRKPAVMACGFCHLADGRGRPENAMVAGLPVDYFVQQVKDMRTRARRSASPVPFPSAAAMEAIADSVTDAELVEAARYFARVRARRESRVIESDSVPKFMPLNGLSTLLPGGGREPLGDRLVEATVDLRRHELHDPMAEYVAYVPRGSLARGRALADEADQRRQRDQREGGQDRAPRPEPDPCSAIVGPDTGEQLRHVRGVQRGGAISLLAAVAPNAKRSVPRARRRRRARSCSARRNPGPWAQGT